MAQYFFDLRSSDAVARDEEGLELPDVEAAHETALHALLTTAREAVLEGSLNQNFAVEVRDGAGPVLEVAAQFHSRIFRKQ
jgi:uncharacterized protein DUF6894